MPARGIDTQRQLTQEVEALSEAELRRLFFQHHTAYPPDAPYSEWTRKYGLTLIAREAEAAARLRREFTLRFETQQERQRRWTQRLGWLSPAVALRQTLDELAETNETRQRRFLQQAAQYNRAWKAFFWPRFFVESTFAAADYDAIPRFQFQEQPGRQVFRQAASGLVQLWLGLLCIAGGCCSCWRQYISIQ